MPGWSRGRHGSVGQTKPCSSGPGVADSSTRTPFSAVPSCVPPPGACPRGARRAQAQLLGLPEPVLPERCRQLQSASSARRGGKPPASLPLTSEPKGGGGSHAAPDGTLVGFSPTDRLGPGFQTLRPRSRLPAAGRWPAWRSLHQGLPPQAGPRAQGGFPGISAPGGVLCGCWGPEAYALLLLGKPCHSLPPPCALGLPRTQRPATPWPGSQRNLGPGPQPLGEKAGALSLSQSVCSSLKWARPS